MAEVHRNGKAQGTNYNHVSHRLEHEGNERTPNKKKKQWRYQGPRRWGEERKKKDGGLKLTSLDCQSPLRNPSAPTSVHLPP